MHNRYRINTDKISPRHLIIENNWDRSRGDYYDYEIDSQNSVIARNFTARELDGHLYPGKTKEYLRIALSEHVIGYQLYKTRSNQPTWIFRVRTGIPTDEDRRISELRDKKAKENEKIADKHSGIGYYMRERREAQKKRLNFLERKVFGESLGGWF